jgi:hypothetical protein
MLVKTEGSSGRSSPCRSRQSDAEKATRARKVLQLMWKILCRGSVTLLMTMAWLVFLSQLRKMLSGHLAD